MKKDSFKLIIMSVAVICIVIAGIMVPGIVLEANQKSEHDHVAKVPKSYLPSGSVMAKEASANLKLSEKLSLIDGQWDSTTARQMMLPLMRWMSRIIRQLPHAEKAWKSFMTKSSIL